MTSIPAHTRCHQALPWAADSAGVSEISPFAQSLLTIYYQELEQCCMPIFPVLVVLMATSYKIWQWIQYLFIQKVPVVPKHRRKGSQVRWAGGSGGSRTQREQPTESQKIWNWSHTPDSRWMSAKMHLKTSTATAEITKHQIYPLTPWPHPLWHLKHPISASLTIPGLLAQ